MSNGSTSQSQSINPRVPKEKARRLKAGLSNRYQSGLFQLIVRPIRPQRGMNFSLSQDQYLMNASPLIAERSTNFQNRLS